MNDTMEQPHSFGSAAALSEIDFVCSKGSKRYYIQSAYAIPNQTKMKKEQ